MFMEELRYVETSQTLQNRNFSQRLEVSINQYAETLSAITALIKSNEQDVSSENFSRFVQSLSLDNDLGVYFAKYVPASHKLEYERGMQENLNRPQFKIFPEGDREEFLPLTLGYPHKIVFGYDLLAPDYEQLESVIASRNAIKTTLSQPISITVPDWNAGNEADSFLLRKSVYLPPESRVFKTTDRSGFYGMAGIFFKVDELLENIREQVHPDLSYRVADVTSTDNIIWFADSKPSSEWDKHQYNTQYLLTGDRQWRIDTAHFDGVFYYINWTSIFIPFTFLTLLAFFLAAYARKFSSIYRSALNAANQRFDTDELTGLLSRYRVQKVLDEQLLVCQRKGKWLATLVLDLDHFKTINDAFGHEVGDKVLSRVAQRLKSMLPEEAVVGYLGGDGFLVLLPQNETYDLPQLDNLVKETIHQLSQSYFIDGRTLNIGCSIGVALAPRFGTDSVTLIKNADMAVYHAKTLGRATYHFYDGEMGKRFARNVRIEARLREAIKNESLELHFQPKVCIETERCVGMEALLRWHDDELGDVSPAEFIPLAEQTGIILPLGEWVFEQAFRHLLEWQEQGISVPPIAINCSAAQLKRVDFLPNLLALLDKYKIDPSLLEVEVTESILIEDPERCAELLRQISRLGIKLALDDFGTGYSSLSYLKDLPFHYVKIDQVFVRDIIENKNNAALTKAIISLSHDLDLKVIAEGITNVEQLALLREYDCDIGQGYLFSKAFGANSMASDPMIVALNKQEGL